MIKVLTLFLFLLFSLDSYAQNTIHGKTTDENGNSIPGVNVYIKDAYDGAISDSTGKFTFKTSSEGPVTLIGSFIGYKSAEQYLDINKNNIEINLKLIEEISELNAVVITAGSFEAGDKKRATVLSLLDIITTAGADADISATLQTVPGVQKVGEQEGLFVRGGSAEEAKIIIDGAVVNNFFYSSIPGIASRGRFSPFYLAEPLLRAVDIAHYMDKHLVLYLIWKVLICLQEVSFNLECHQFFFQPAFKKSIRRRLKVLEQAILMPILDCTWLLFLNVLTYLRHLSVMTGI